MKTPRPGKSAGIRTGMLGMLAVAFAACSELATGPQELPLETALTVGTSSLGTPQVRVFEVCATFPQGGATSATVRVDVVREVNTTTPTVVPSFQHVIPANGCEAVWASGAAADEVTVRQINPSQGEIGFYSSLTTGSSVINQPFVANDSDFTGRIGGDVGRTITFVSDLDQTADIGDLVWDDTDEDGIQDQGEPGLAGVTVRLKDAGGAVIATAVTGSAGQYLFSGLPSGSSYTVTVDASTLPSNYTASPSDQGSNRGVDSNGSPATVTLSASAQSDRSVDFGYHAVSTPGGTGNIGNLVWHDLNGNGLQLDGEPGIGGVRIDVKDAGGTVVATTTTRSDGLWIVGGLNVGETYTVDVDESTLPANLVPSPAGAGSDRKWDSNAEPVSVTLTAGASVDHTIDFGYRTQGSTQTGSIGDRVWDDSDQDGIQDSGEPGLGGVRLELRDSGGTLVASQTTGQQGAYGFTGLNLNESYTVEIVSGTLPSGYVASPYAAGPDRSNDSNGSPATVVLTATNADDDGIDFGFFKPTSSTGPTSPRGDVTSQLEDLGEPFYPGNTYAKNPWDMLVHQGRLYVGHGNSSNEGPSSSGRSTFGDIWYLDLQTDTWVLDWSVPQDQIDVFRVINGDLYIPGHDSGPGATEQDGYYRLRNGTWTKHRKKTIHVYDVYEYAGYTWTAVGANFGAAVRRTPDGGQTINEFNLVQVDPARVAGRAFSLFEIAGKLYTSATHMWADMDPLTYRTSKIFRYTNNAWVHVSRSFFPGAPTDELRVARPVNLGNKTVYIGATNYNDHQWKPYGLYRATSETSISHVSLPHGAKPTDLLVRGSDLFVLATKLNGNGTFTNYVFTSTNASSFTEVLSFRHEGFARSFEIDGSDYYFGIGDDGAMSCNPTNYTCTWTDRNFVSTTGDILRLR